MISDNIFEKQAEILNQRFYLLLEDFKKTFLLFKENERYQLNRRKFTLATDQLQNCYKDIVLLDNKIEKKTNSSLNGMKVEKKKNRLLKKKNDELKDKLSQLEHGDTTSEQMYDDTKILYIQQYIRLIIIILGLIVLLTFLYLVVMEEPYTFGSNISFAKKVLIFITITLLVWILANRSVGINVEEPVIDWFEEKGWFDDFSLNF
tara:strand:+ start:263 stop:877 length:615 start_codon:yes stop_codon:yes gene_type:complete